MPASGDIPGPSQTSGPLPTVSIIMPVLNEADRITETVARTLRDFPDCELIVVDGGSSDDTARLVEPRAQLVRGRTAATSDVATTRTGPVIVIGTDCPVLNPAHLATATKQLRQGRDMVLGPAHDGGYYLIALARPDPRLFALPTHAWGGPDVATLTMRAATTAGLSTGLIDAEHDLDTPADIAPLLADPRLPPQIAAILLEQEAPAR